MPEPERIAVSRCPNFDVTRVVTRGAKFPVFPVEPAILSIVLRKHAFVTKIIRQINHLPENSRSP